MSVLYGRTLIRVSRFDYSSRLDFSSFQGVDAILLVSCNWRLTMKIITFEQFIKFTKK